MASEIRRVLLSARCAYAFSTGSTDGGRTYFDEGRVSLRSVDDCGATAEVAGMQRQPYRVSLEWAQAVSHRDLGVACTCRHFADGFYCKHIFAAVLAVDENVAQRESVVGDRILKLVPIEVERSSALDADDLDQAALLGEGAARG